MSILTIYIDRSGVERATATVRTISESAVAAEVMQAASLPLRLLSDSVRAHFEGKEATPSTTDDYPAQELDVYICACGSKFHSAGSAVDHVEADHASPRIRQDLDKLEDTIEGLITPCPLAPLPTEIIKDRTFGAELIKELTVIFVETKVGDEKSAVELVEYCGWDEIADMNYDEVKVRIIDHDHAGGKNRIQPPMHETYMTAVALFLRQVGKLSNKYTNYRSE